MARLFIELYGPERPQEIAAVVAMLPDTGRHEAARLWTEIMDASCEALAARGRARLH